VTRFSHLDDTTSLSTLAARGWVKPHHLGHLLSAPTPRSVRTCAVVSGQDPELLAAFASWVSSAPEDLLDEALQGWSSISKDLRSGDDLVRSPAVTLLFERAGAYAREAFASSVRFTTLELVPWRPVAHACLERGEFPEWLHGAFHHCDYELDLLDGLPLAAVLRAVSGLKWRSDAMPWLRRALDTHSVSELSAPELERVAWDLLDGSDFLPGTASSGRLTPGGPMVELVEAVSDALTSDPGLRHEVREHVRGLRTAHGSTWKEHALPTRARLEAIVKTGVVPDLALEAVRQPGNESLRALLLESGSLTPYQAVELFDREDVSYIAPLLTSRDARWRQAALVAAARRLSEDYQYCHLLDEVLKSLSDDEVLDDLSPDPGFLAEEILDSAECTRRPRLKATLLGRTRFAEALRSRQRMSMVLEHLRVTFAESPHAWEVFAELFEDFDGTVNGLVEVCTDLS
jgi:hypothetical protein